MFCFNDDYKHTHTHATLVSHVLALSPPPPPPPKAPGRIGSDRNFRHQAPCPPAPRPNFFPMVCLRHPRHVVTSSRSRFVSRPLGSENWTLGTKLDLTSPSKETNFSPSCVTCWVFLVLVFFLKTAASQHCFSNTAFSTEMPKTAGLGTEEKRDCSTRSIHFSGGLFSSHILEHVSRLFITVFAFHCYRFMSMPNSVWGKWSFRNLNVFLFLVYFFNVFATLSPRWVCWFYLPCLVSICVSPPPTYRTIFLKSLISVFIHTFFSFFLLNLGHVAYIHFTNCFILCFTESFISD